MTALFERLVENEPVYSSLELADYWRHHCKRLLSGHRMLPTKRQAECLKVVKAFIARHDYPPSLREISALMPGTRSPSGVVCFLDALEERGYLTRIYARQRAITIIELPPHESVDVV